MFQFRIRSPFLALILLLGLETIAAAQTISLSLSPGSAIPGGSAILNVSMAVSAGAQPAAVQWTIAYSAMDVASVVITPGGNASSAGKTVLCSAGAGSQTCLIYGMNASAIPAGVIAQLAVALSPTTKSTSTNIQMSASVSSDLTGAALPTTASGAVVNIAPVPSLTDLTCSPATVSAGGSVSCAIALSSAAPSNGFAIALSGGPQVGLPATIAVAGGAVSANFTGAISPSASGQVAITASAGGASKTAFIEVYQPVVSSFTCAQTTIVSGSSQTCTVVLQALAPPAGQPVSVSSSSAELIPASAVIVPGGATTASFPVQAAGIAVQDVQLTATVNTSSATTTVTVLALQIQGTRSESSNTSIGATVTPTVAPDKFNGTLMVSGTGAVNFAPSGSGPGVSFVNCCSNTDGAFYKFTGAGLGRLFDMNRGQISFAVKSTYTFAQRQTIAAGAARTIFDVQDNSAANRHLFYFQTEYLYNSLWFYYAIGGVGFWYQVPQGTEDTLFGGGVTLNVILSWANGVANLYLNGALAKAAPYTALVAAWGNSSILDFGGREYFTFGGYNSCDDQISQFVIGVPIKP